MLTCFYTLPAYLTNNSWSLFYRGGQYSIKDNAASLRSLSISVLLAFFVAWITIIFVRRVWNKIKK